MQVRETIPARPSEAVMMRDCNMDVNQCVVMKTDGFEARISQSAPSINPFFVGMSLRCHFYQGIEFGLHDFLLV
jgi:hypothetical protein